uniref:Uncharacterized protein n=1 Tax=Triticum urartu TaxID=4572 RepID=A0A8R7UW16_TRIUA
MIISMPVLVAKGKFAIIFRSAQKGLTNISRVANYVEVQIFNQSRL